MRNETLSPGGISRWRQIGDALVGDIESGALPPGRKSWRESLVSAALDAGVERDQKLHAPRWMLAFDPCDPSRKTVELDGSGTTVGSVNGGPAPKMP